MEGGKRAVKFLFNDALRIHEYQSGGWKIWRGSRASMHDKKFPIALFRDTKMAIKSLQPNKSVANRAVT